MYSLTASTSNTSSCPSHSKGLVEIKCRGREKKSRLLLPLHIWVCAHVLYKLTLRGESIREEGMDPQATSTSQNLRPVWGY